MVITLKTLVESQQSLDALRNMHLPAQIAFEIGTILRKVQTELSVYAEEHRKIVELYSDGAIENSPQNIGEVRVRIKAGSEIEFAKKVEELGNVEVSKDFDFEPIKLSVLQNQHAYPKMFADLYWLFINE